MRTKLFSPYKIGGMELQNRISVPPMCMYQATDGMPNVWHNVHYGKLAQSGAALVCVEATAVCPEVELPLMTWVFGPMISVMLCEKWFRPCATLMTKRKSSFN